jgi:hypothetical protein
MELSIFDNPCRSETTLRCSDAQYFRTLKQGSLIYRAPPRNSFPTKLHSHNLVQLIPVIPLKLHFLSVEVKPDR